MANSARISFRNTWDGSLFATDHSRPRGSAAVLMLCESSPEPDDGCFPEAVNAAMAAALVACGIVAARWFYEEPPGQGAELFLPEQRGALRKLMETFTSTFPVPLTLTRDAAVAAGFFDGAWAMQYQALMILDPLDDTGRDAALAALRTRRDWRDFCWPISVLAVCMPGVDGDVMMIAAETEHKVARVAGALREKLAAAGFQIRSGE